MGEPIVATVTYGENVPSNPSRGWVGGTLSIGPFGSISYGLNETGNWVATPSIGYKGLKHSAISGDWGWSVPVGPISFGERYTADGTYGVFGIYKILGWKNHWLRDALGRKLK